MCGTVIEIRSFILSNFSLEFVKEAFAMVAVLVCKFEWFDLARDILLCAKLTTPAFTESSLLTNASTVSIKPIAHAVGVL